MTYNKNLRPFATLTEEQQREIRSKGGKASVEAKRRRKKMKDLAQELLASEALKLDPAEAKRIATQLGLLPEEVSVSDLMLSSITQKAIHDKDVSAFNAIRDTAEGKPTQSIDHKGIEKTTPIVFDVSGLKIKE
jgi:hypothetical protein